jgi:hypothetical protein
LTETLTLLPVLPLVGVTASHVAEVAAAKLIALPLLATLMGCAAGVEPPI